MGSITKLETPKPPPFPLDYDVFHHYIHVGREFQREHDFQLPKDWFWRYMEYRYDIAPHRFTFYHPTVGHMIMKEHEHVPIVPIVPTTPDLPFTPSIPTVPGPPSIIMMALGIIGIFIFTRYYGASPCGRKNCPDIHRGCRASLTGRSHVRGVH